MLLLKAKQKNKKGGRICCEPQAPKHLPKLQASALEDVDSLAKDVKDLASHNTVSQPIFAHPL